MGGEEVVVEVKWKQEQIQDRIFQTNREEIQNTDRTWDKNKTAVVYLNKSWIRKSNPRAAAVENPPANAGDSRDMVSIPLGKSPWRRKWQPTPESLPGEFYGQESSGLQSVGQTGLRDLSTHTQHSREEAISTEAGGTKRWDLTGRDQSNRRAHLSADTGSHVKKNENVRVTWICHSLGLWLWQVI